jgi:hypothetical protein
MCIHFKRSIFVILKIDILLYEEIIISFIITYFS